MATELILRRGTAAEHETFVGVEGEVTVNTDTRALRVHDGVTQGGFEVARVDLTNVSNETFAAKAQAAGLSLEGGGGGGGTGAGAPVLSTYLVVNLDPDLPNERRLQAGNGLISADGGPGGGFTISANYASTVPANLGSAAIGTSIQLARADHVHAMPTATDVGAVPTSRQVIAGNGLSGGGALTGNVTLALNANLNALTDVTILSPQNGDFLVFNGATSRFENTQNISRLTTRVDGTVVGTNQGIRTLNFTGTGLTVAAQSGDPSQVNISVNAGLSQTQVQDIVGTMVTGNTQTGIAVTYNDATKKINFATNNFTIALSGDVQGSATVTNLGNVTINTVVAPNAVALGTDTTGNYVATLAVGQGLILSNSAATLAGAQFTIAANFVDATFVEAVEDVVGAMVSGNTENGINVTYDDPNGKLNFQVNPFTVTLTGSVNGSGTVTNLSNVSIATTIPENAITLGTQTVGSYVASIAPSGPITVSGSGVETAAVTLGFNYSNADFIENVEDIVGTMVSLNTETGINVTYDDAGGKLNFAVNNFSVTLGGAVTGSATVTGLTNTTITTSMAAGAVTLGTHTTGNYVATATGTGGITVSGSGVAGAGLSIGINSANADFREAIEDIVGAMVTGTNVESGINVTYADPGGKLNFDVNDFTLTLNGAVTGAATIVDLANTTITTSMAAGAVTLGTHTTGNFVQTITAGNGIVVSGAGAANANVTLAVNVNNPAIREDIEDIVGSMVTGNTETGIDVVYDDPNGKLNFVVNNFNVTLSGAITGTATVTGLSNTTLNTTLATGAVTLGTHTTGNYVASVAVSGNGLTRTGTGAGAQVTVTSNATNANTPSTIVFRDASGNFSAGTITANLTGNASGNVLKAGDTMTGTLTLSTGNLVVSTGHAQYSVASSVTAAGTTQSTAAGLSRDINVVTSSTANSGVRLPSAAVGMVLWVINATANQIVVYPSSGANIDGFATNVGFSLGAGAKLQFVASSTTQWWAITSVYA